MSPHRACFKTYGPSSTLVEVANGQVVRAEGVGTVEFHPVDLEGHSLPPVEFTGVLHIPTLNQNLLSLTLTEKRNFSVLIEKGSMAFIRDKEPWFYAE
ncbi:hypothetical protein DL93DRAFT_2135586 [Clavulina sp. PMI_390]|nr:hypothetical protein DL93DRAFT_2135586 [Clavulina sp. PMI_390]